MRLERQAVDAAGQIVGQIDDIPSCAELIQRMVMECRERLGVAQSGFAPATGI